MSYVCLWSPSWPAGAAFDAELVPALLAHAPRIVVGDAGRVWVDARGLHASMLAERLVATLREHAVAGIRAGAAITPIAADVAATWTPALEHVVLAGVQAGHVILRASLAVVPPGHDRDFIAGFPVSVLEPSPFLATLLDGIGVDRCGRLAALDAESVEVRLGPDGVRLWQRARADDDRWLFRTPIRALPSASLEWMEYALRDSERLLFVINALLSSVCLALAAHGQRARELTLLFSLANRTQHSLPLRSARPTSSQARWLRLVHDALERLTLPDAVMGIALRIESVTGNDGAQGDLFDRGFASAEAVEVMLANLADDHGELVVAPRSSEHPLAEQRTRWVSEDPAMVAARTIAARTIVIDRPPTVPQLTLQLITPPEPIVVTTQARRDHAIPVRYRDGTGWHQVTEVAGPDRVSGMDWETADARDYFRCVRDDGMFVWVFSRGMEWYLHGWWD
jgi:protein ImuB